MVADAANVCRGGKRNEGEEEGGDCDEEEALLAEHAAAHAEEGEPGFWGLGK